MPSRRAWEPHQRRHSLRPQGLCRAPGSGREPSGAYRKGQEGNRLLQGWAWCLRMWTLIPFTLCKYLNPLRNYLASRKPTETPRCLEVSSDGRFPCGLTVSVLSWPYSPFRVAPIFSQVQHISCKITFYFFAVNLPWLSADAWCFPPSSGYSFSALWVCVSQIPNPQIPSNTFHFHSLWASTYQ